MSAKWRDRGCAGIPWQTFFPKSSSSARYDDARAACEGCPIRVECLTLAEHTEAGRSLAIRAGMFGGKTPEERTAADPTAEMVPGVESPDDRLTIRAAAIARRNALKRAQSKARRAAA